LDLKYLVPTVSAILVIYQLHVCLVRDFRYAISDWPRVKQWVLSLIYRHTYCQQMAPLCRTVPLHLWSRVVLKLVGKRISAEPWHREDVCTGVESVHTIYIQERVNRGKYSPSSEVSGQHPCYDNGDDRAWRMWTGIVYTCPAHVHPVVMSLSSSINDDLSEALSNRLLDYKNPIID
jgi:hypothetical protein